MKFLAVLFVSILSQFPVDPLMFFAAIIDTVTSVVLHGHILNLTDNCLSQNEQTTFVGVDAAGGVGGGVDSV